MDFTLSDFLLNFLNATYRIDYISLFDISDC